MIVLTIAYSVMGIWIKLISTRIVRKQFASSQFF